MTPENVTPAHLKKIFYAAESSLFELSPLSKKDLNSNFHKFKNINPNKIDWNKFYELIAFVAFYSGFKAETVNNKQVAIKKVLGNLTKVAAFKASDIKACLKNESIIKHEGKIKACVFNAKKIIELKTEHKTLQNYMALYGDLEEIENLNAFAKDLRKRFRYLGVITVNHLLLDLGLYVVKPDRVLCRIFFRLGLINAVEDYRDVIKIGRLINKATGLPIRYIDLIFVFYGQVGHKRELNIDNGICLEKNPKCDICKLKAYCNYYKQNN